MMKGPRKIAPLREEENSDDESITWEGDDISRRELLSSVRRISVDSTRSNHSHRSAGSSNSFHEDEDLAPTRARLRKSFDTRTSSCMRLSQDEIEAHTTVKEQSVASKSSDEACNSSSSAKKKEGWDNLRGEILRAMQESLDDSNGNNIEGNCSNSSIDYTSREGPWSCSACTFLNDNPLHLVCGMCGTAKSNRPSLPPSLDDSHTSLDSRSNKKGRRKTEPPLGSFESSEPGDDHSNNSLTELESKKHEPIDLESNKPPPPSRKSKENKFGKKRNGSVESSISNDSDQMYNDMKKIENEIGGIRGKLEASDGGQGSSQHADELRSSLQSLHEKLDGLRSSMASNQLSTAQAMEDEFGDTLRSLRQSNEHRRRHKKHNDRSKRLSRSVGSEADNFNITSNSSRTATKSVKQPSGLRRSVGHDLDDLKSPKSSLKSSTNLSRRNSVEFDVKNIVSVGPQKPPGQSGSEVDNVSISSRSSKNATTPFKKSGGISDGNSSSHLLSSVEFEQKPLDQSYYSISDDDDRTTRTMATIKSLRHPEKEATIIYTDVQGSTSLWEAVPLSMKKATDVHDSIIRKCYADHGGYEISTEGDSFNLAFQHPADAIGFALKAQLALYKADWPDEILNHPDGNFNEKKAFRGFRVRMGMHHGPVESSVHDTTGRTIYQGEAVDIAKSIEKMSHGGQILTTVETWRTVSGMAEQHLGKPQVMDCGEHLLFDPKKAQKSKSSSKTKYQSKRIIQLVPNQLAYDFFAARGGQEVKKGEAPPRVCGRVFPPLLSHGQLSTSFLNAPFIKNRVAMVFVYTDKMENAFENERRRNQKFLAKYIRKHLMRLSPPGYECQEDKGSWMLAFDSTENGIKFALDLNETVSKSQKLRGDIDQNKLFRIGIHWGPFLSMGPHTITGHADYFGPIVNRAARVAAQCEPGQVCVGVPMDVDEEPPDPGPTVEIEVLGVKQLKGITTQMAIFLCRKTKEQMHAGNKQAEIEET